MTAKKTSATDYLLMSFVLTADDEGRPIQRRSYCGSYASVEEAFEFAREMALVQWRQLSEKAALTHDGRNAELVSTEWGYELRQGPLVVQRFWVHDPCSMTAA